MLPTRGRSPRPAGARSPAPAAPAPSVPPPAPGAAPAQRRHAAQAAHGARGPHQQHGQRRGHRHRAEREVLPKAVVPLRYCIRIAPDLCAFTFAGAEEVEVVVREQTPSITLNALELRLTSAVLMTTDGRPLQARAVTYDTGRGTCTLEFGEALAPGRAVLSLAFTGVLSDKLSGFYRSRSADGRPIAVTQFEPCDARRAFPCWDEPAAKATFRIALVVPEGLRALSNMPEESRVQLEGGLVEVAFCETPLMSTYLVALAVGDFDYLEARTREGVVIRVYTQVGKKALGQFALGVSAWVLSYFGEFFGIEYPLPKCDLVAIPDFSFGAMENWGLITFRETSLLIDEEKSSIAARQLVAYWFGNLVTMEWWSDLWLNEGFATWVGTYAVAKLFPQWDTWTSFVSGDVFKALQLDCLASTHPVEVPIACACEVNDIFDAISYSKGAAVIRMLATFLGEDTLRKGLHTYLTRFSFKNTVTDDLWDAWKEASGIDVKVLIGPWTKTPGYPVLQISSISPTELLVVQERFYASGASGACSQTWWIPLQVASSSQELHGKQFHFTGKQDVITHSGGDFWIKANYGQTGLFRIKYDETLLRKLYEVISLKLVPAVDRLGIESDAFALAESGLIPTSQALSIALAYTQEEDCTVWADLAGNLANILVTWRREPTYDTLLALVRKLFRPIATSLGWDKRENEPDLVLKLRATVMRRLLLAGDLEVRNEALRRFEASLVDPSSLPNDQRGLVYVAAARYGGADGLEKLKGIFRTADMQQQREVVLSSIGATGDGDSAYRILEWASFSKEVRLQDFFLVVNSVSSYWPEVSWAFLKDKWSWFGQSFARAPALVPRIISLSTITLSSSEQLQDVRTFFETHQLPGASIAVRQSLETIKVRADWLSRSRTDVAIWLESQQF
eukprot:m51a1_g1941 hypothetical protein (908) ;mRNA; f:934424-938807